MKREQLKAYRIALCTDIIVANKNTINLRKYYEDALSKDENIGSIPTEPTILNDMKEAREGLANKYYDPKHEAIIAVEIVKDVLQRAVVKKDKYCILKCIEQLDKWFDFGTNIPKRQQEIDSDKLKEYLS